MNIAFRRAGRFSHGARLVSWLTVLPALLTSGAVHAGSNYDARLAIHLASVASKNSCARLEAAPACSNVITSGTLYPTAYYAYLLIMRGNAAAGLAGLQCGIAYDGVPHSGVDVFDWHLCADLDFRSTGWPASGGGNLITWDPIDRCQRSEPDGPGSGVTATVGYFYLAAYSPDVLRITPRPVDGRAKVGSCAADEDILEGGTIHHDPSFLGSASFSTGGMTPGHNPCSAPTTAIDCSISGPSSVFAGSIASYRALAAPPGSTFQWDISGNGVITGATTGPSVTVLADDIDGATFSLAVTVGTPAGVRTCTATVAIIAPPAPGCQIYRPSYSGNVIEDSPGNLFSVQVNQPYANLSWSITGDGTITSGSDSAQVTVLAGQAGSFELSVHFTTAAGIPGTCSRRFPVDAVPCGFSGTSPVAQFRTGVPYTASYAYPGGSYAWEISGSGTIAGSAQNPVVFVDVGGEGTINLTLAHTRNGRLHTCSQTITVTATPPPPPPHLNPAKLLLHLIPSTNRNACDGRWVVSCNRAQTAGSLAPTSYFAYLLVADGNRAAGISALQCGIDYNPTPGAGVDVFSWTHCAVFEAGTDGPNGTWPTAGSGDRIFWDMTTMCQRTEPGGVGSGVVAAAGYFYLTAYSPDRIEIRPRPIDGQAQVADCSFNVDVIGGIGFPPGAESQLGSASFSPDGSVRGYNPCGTIVNVQPSTWSRIKGMFATPGAH